MALGNEGESMREENSKKNLSMNSSHPQASIYWNWAHISKLVLLRARDKAF